MVIDLSYIQIVSGLLENVDLVQGIKNIFELKGTLNIPSDMMKSHWRCGKGLPFKQLNSIHREPS